MMDGWQKWQRRIAVAIENDDLMMLMCRVLLLLLTIPPPPSLKFMMHFHSPNHARCQHTNSRSKHPFRPNFFSEPNNQPSIQPTTINTALSRHNNNSCHSLSLPPPAPHPPPTSTFPLISQSAFFPNISILPLLHCPTFQLLSSIS